MNQRDLVRVLIGVGGLLAAQQIRRSPPQDRLSNGAAIALLGYSISESVFGRGGGQAFLQALLEGVSG